MNLKPFTSSCLHLHLHSCSNLTYFHCRRKNRTIAFFKWLDVANANFDLSAKMEQERVSELKIKVEKDFARVEKDFARMDKDFVRVDKEIRCLKLGLGLIGIVTLFVFLLVASVLK